MHLLTKTLLGAALALVVLASPAMAGSITDVGFTRITDNNNGVNPASQFELNIYDETSAEALFSSYDGGSGLQLETGEFLFLFENQVGIASNIAEIYFDDDTLLTYETIYNDLGTTSTGFTAGFSGSGSDKSDPPNLPAGSDLDPDFEANLTLSADALNGDGLNQSSDYLGLIFSASSLQAIEDDLADGSLRIGLHVRSIGSVDGSDSFVNGGGFQGDPVPEPATLVLFGAGLVAVGLHRRRSRRA